MVHRPTRPRVGDVWHHVRGNLRGTVVSMTADGRGGTIKCRWSIYEFKTAAFVRAWAPVVCPVVVVYRRGRRLVGEP